MTAGVAGREAKSQRAFLFDLNKCTGCQACELACSIENDLGETSWRQVVTLNEAHHPGVPTMHLSLACNHCEEPPCMEHCPALAYRKDPVTGRVDLEGDLCIGCGYCSWACPYDAPKLDANAGVMTKCTFCGHRQEAGLEPACVEQCPTGALGFGELGAMPGVRDAPGLPTLTPGPSVRFIPWRDGAATATGACAAAPGGVGVRAPRMARKISLRKEWPLVVFTLLATWLVAAFTASELGAFEMPPWLFLSLATVGMGASTAHLGKPTRAWRAMLNVRGSWLSREIVLFSGFVGAVTVLFLVERIVGVALPMLATAAVAVGAASLFAVDRVYDIVRPADARPTHSADALPTAILLTCGLIGNLPVAGATILFKTFLYLRRKLRFRERGVDPRWGWSLGRLGVGLVAPAAIMLVAPQEWMGWALVGVVVGEIIDRCEFYSELEVPTPRGEMARELGSRLRGSISPAGPR